MKRCVLESIGIALCAISLLGCATGHASALLAQGVAAHGRGDIVAAARLFREATQQEPELAEGFYNLAVFAQALGRSDDAAALVERALAVSQEGQGVRVLSAVVLAHTQRWSEAEAALLSADAVGAVSWLVRAGSATDRGDIAGAVEALGRTGVETDSLGVSRLWLETLQALRRGDAVSAASGLRGRTEPELIALRARCLEAAGEHAMARSTLTELEFTGLPPSVRGAVAHLTARLAYQAGDDAAALKALDLALQSTSGESSDIALDRALVLARMGQVSPAMTQTQRVMEQHPGHPRAEALLVMLGSL